MQGDDHVESDTDASWVLPGALAASVGKGGDRGRDAGCPAPPAQIPAGGIPALGSSMHLAFAPAGSVVSSEQLNRAQLFDMFSDPAAEVVRQPARPFYHLGQFHLEAP